MTENIYTKYKPIRILLYGYLAIILAGAVLLCLPISSANGTWQPFIDSLFTAASAVSTTGLVVVDTGSYYSLFGQVVIMVIIQICGLGYMIFMSLIMIGFGRKMSMNSQILLQESINSPSYMSVIKLAKVTLLFTAVFEILGALVFTIRWAGKLGILKAAYYGLFHSISAFCTAGFGLFNDSLMSYRTDWLLNLDVIILSIAGGVGFFVLYDVFKIVKDGIKGETRRLKFHTKFVLVSTVAIIGVSIVLFMLTGGLQTKPGMQELMDASFQVISASTTTGFNTVDIGKLPESGLVLLGFLMFIGASPGSTAGGIKAISVSALWLVLMSVIAGRQRVTAFGRTLVTKSIYKIVAISFASFVFVLLMAFFLTLTEKQAFIKVLFEEMSAFGTAGLSTGITPGLSFSGKVLISISMLVGRVGPLAVGVLILGDGNKYNAEYPDAEIIIG